MNQFFVISALLLLPALLPGCSSKPEAESPSREVRITSEKIKYTVLDGYYKKSDYAELPFCKIESAATFRKYFGESRPKGKDTPPTPIDFENEYIIAVTHPFTNYETSLLPAALERDELGNLIFTYRSEKGKYLPYRVLPSLLIKVNHTVKGDIVLAEVE